MTFDVKSRIDVLQREVSDNRRRINELEAQIRIMSFWINSLPLTLAAWQKFQEDLRHVKQS